MSSSLPLHPAIVHFPLALAMLMPVVAAGLAWTIWTRRMGPRAWLSVVALQGLLAGSALVAINTGSSEEERVEQVVPERALHQHEESAEQFGWATGAALVLSALVLLARSRSVAGGVTVAAVVATVVMSALALRVGHAGGELVYSHNAGAAYARPAVESAGLTPVPGDSSGTRDAQDRDHDRER